MSAPQYLVVDAFAERPFTGNPAAVVLLPGPADEQWMGSVAAEFGLSETAFVYRLAEGAWALRWMTPIVEVPLCGHATLAAAHALWSLDLEPGTRQISFATRSGELKVDQDNGRIRLDLPSRPIGPIRAPGDLAPVDMAQCLGGVACRVVGQTLEPDPDVRDYLIEVADQAALAAARPVFSELARWPTGGVILTAPADPSDVDVVSRYFAPRQGIQEDPVTGSAHCALSGYWSARLGRDSFRARQLSARPGTLQVLARGDRTHLVGAAITMMSGEIRG
jgi:PhzF family phenazine biosynthesis protein